MPAALLCRAEFAIETLGVLAAAQLGARAQQGGRPRRDAEAHRLGKLPTSRKRHEHSGEHAVAGANAADSRNPSRRKTPACIPGREQRAIGPERDDEHLATPLGNNGARRLFQRRIPGDRRAAQLAQLAQACLDQKNARSGADQCLARAIEREARTAILRKVRHSAIEVWSVHRAAGCRWRRQTCVRGVICAASASSSRS